MAKNLLLEGEPRLGWLVDGNADTPHVAVMLQNTGKQVLLTVPFRDTFSDPYMRWFSRGVRFGDDPGRKKYTYSPPRVLMFKDSNGPVVLVGCRSSGMSMNFGGTSTGHGRIYANFAVLGGRGLRYEEINGLRTELPALALWGGITSLAISSSTDADGRMKSLEIAVDSPPEIPLDRMLNLTLRPSWRTSRSDGGQTFSTHDVAQLRTLRKKSASWDEHLHRHEAVRGLLSLSAWQSFGYSSIEVNRADDPARLLNGEVIGERWSPVISHLVRQHVPWKKDPRFLFEFDDIGASGVRKWLDIRTHFSRTIDPLLGLVDGVEDYFDTGMVQTGIAIEALGYQLELDSPTGRLRNGQVSYPAALERILEDMPFVPLSDIDGWKARSQRCYKGVKHADNPTPDALELANAYRENLLVLRFWLAGRLGCKLQALRDGRDRDPLAQEYSFIE